MTPCCLAGEYQRCHILDDGDHYSFTPHCFEVHSKLMRFLFLFITLMFKTCTT